MLKKFHQFISEQVSTQALSPAQESFLNDCTMGSWSINPQTGLVDVDGDFNCRKMGLSDFMGIRFGNVSGYFDCGDNSLTSLEGSPRSVGRSFTCSDNKLTTLEGSPENVGYGFICSNNLLTTLKGITKSPKSTKNYIGAHSNFLISLEGANPLISPVRVNTNFNPMPKSVLLASLKSQRTYLKAIQKAVANNEINLPIDLEWIDI